MGWCVKLGKPNPRPSAGRFGQSTETCSSFSSYRSSSTRNRHHCPTPCPMYLRYPWFEPVSCREQTTTRTRLILECQATRWLLEGLVQQIALIIFLVRRCHPRLAYQFWHELVQGSRKDHFKLVQVRSTIAKTTDNIVDTYTLLFDLCRRVDSENEPWMPPQNETFDEVWTPAQPSPPILCQTIRHIKIIIIMRLAIQRNVHLRLHRLFSFHKVLNVLYNRTDEVAFTEPIKTPLLSSHTNPLSHL